MGVIGPWQSGRLEAVEVVAREGNGFLGQAGWCCCSKLLWRSLEEVQVESVSSPWIGMSVQALDEESLGRRGRRFVKGLAASKMYQY